MSNEDELHDRVGNLELQVAALGSAVRPRGVRKRSATELFGWPLWEIAVGPDPVAGQARGHAKAIIAVGDIATGGIAIGGLARGVFALGGLTGGIFALGGLSVGLVALGGVAVGGVSLGGCALGGVAFGGAAIGGLACGGAAVGYYAYGGGAFGKFVYSAMRRDPEAVAIVRAAADFFGIRLP